MVNSDMGALLASSLAEPEVPVTTADLIGQTLSEIKALLLAKNASYNDSALSPLRLFSRASAVESLLVRIDDKLSRIRALMQEAAPAGDEILDDTLRDLAGYLVLLLIARRA